MEELEELAKEIQFYYKQIGDLIESIGPNGKMDFDTALALNTRYQELMVLCFKHQELFRTEYNKLAEHANVVIRENNLAVATIAGLKEMIKLLSIK